MGEVLRRRLQQRHFDSPVHEAILNVVVAAHYIRDRNDQTLARYRLTSPQYNVLRILRGVYPAGHARCEIAARMLDRAPDVTRIIDRLEEKGLVERERSSSDRRHSITRITRAGLRLLERLDAPIRRLITEIPLSARDCRELSRICEKIYDED
ncbi:MAG TPA: MarR family transcriptional regulator [Thermoanaerobaculia bacterium]|nr:MarR family transcriptional regulator [Thermoanaerobaculia bacterium]